MRDHGGVGVRKDKWLLKIQWENGERGKRDAEQKAQSQRDKKELRGLSRKRVSRNATADGEKMRMMKKTSDVVRGCEEAFVW